MVSRSSNADFIRSSVDLTSSLRARNIPNIPENKWKEILNEVDFDNYIMQIREDLLSKAFDEITRKFIDNQRIKYIVECAYESWKKIICLNFFFHDPCNEFYRKTSSWTPDMEPEPCKPDSWSRGNVSMKKQEIQIQKPEQIDTVLSDYQLIKLTDYPEDNYYSYSKLEPQVDISIQESKDDTNLFYSQYEFATTTPASVSENMSEEIIVNHMFSSDIFEKEEEVEEELFYTRLKLKDVSLPSIPSGLKITPQKILPSFPVEDYPKKTSFPPLRQPVQAAVRTAVELEPLVPPGHKGSTCRSVHEPRRSEPEPEPEPEPHAPGGCGSTPAARRCSDPTPNNPM